MKCTWTSIGIRVVPASFSCCQSLLGQPHADRATALFGRVLEQDELKKWKAPLQER